MIWLGLLPILTLLGLVPVCAGKNHRSLRESLALAWITWSLLVVAATEGLNTLNAITPRGMLCFWLPAAILVLFLAWRHRNNFHSWWTRRPRNLAKVEWWFISLLALLIASAGITAILSPPNNIDCLTYHMPRQVWWLLHGNVHHYQTTISRQVHMPPLAEFMGLQMLSLTWTDYFSCFPACAGWLLSLLAASLITRDLAGNRLSQLFSATLVALIPVGYLQASTQSNDPVLASYLLILTWYSLRAYQGWKGWREIILGAITLSLLELTKGTALILAIPPCLLLAYSLLRDFYRPRWRPAGLISIIALFAFYLLVLNGPHWLRNYRQFHNPLAPPGESALYALQTHTPAALTSNLLRNIALHLSWPSLTRANHTEAVVRAVHSFLGISDSDPRTTYLSLSFQLQPFPTEDFIPAPLYLALAAIVPLLSLIGRRKFRGHLGYWPSLLIPYACFLLFCITLKWQPWHTRLHLPIFCLLASPAAIAFIQLTKPFVAIVLSAIGLALLSPAFLLSPRPLLGPRNIFTLSRNDLMFSSLSLGMEQNTSRLLTSVRQAHPHSIAIQTLGTGFEYPLLWKLTQLNPRPELFPFSGSFGPPARNLSNPPDAVIAIEQPDDHLTDPLTGIQFHRILELNPYSVYLSSTDAPLWQLPLPLMNSINSTGFSPPQTGASPAAKQRRAFFPASSLTIQWLGGLALLTFEAKSPLDNQSLQIYSNHEPIPVNPITLSHDFQQWTVPIPLQPGSNQIEFHYSKGTPGDTAALFRHIYLSPARTQ